MAEKKTVPTTISKTALEFPSIAVDIQSTSGSVLSSTLSEDCGENASFKDERSESIPQLPMMIQENSKVGEKVETDGGENAKVRSFHHLVRCPESHHKLHLHQCFHPPFPFFCIVILDRAV